jgi:predicted phosphohydrolase
MTDPHLNFIPTEYGARIFGEYLVDEYKFDSVVITGDIGEAPSVCKLLKQFANGVERPVYFVLGNHDYYRGSFQSVQRKVEELDHKNLIWLDKGALILLDENTALVGHGGWFDALLGKPKKSHVILNDFDLIEELNVHFDRYTWNEKGGRTTFLKKVKALGQQAADEALPMLLQALQARETVIFATHYPPFKEACWYDGAPSDSRWLPWFTCAAMGKMLLEVASEHPQNKILVLCGHTHGEGEYEAADNLTVLTAKARYGVPNVAEIFILPFDELPFGFSKYHKTYHKERK